MLYLIDLINLNHEEHGRTNIVTQIINQSYNAAINKKNIYIYIYI